MGWTHSLEGISKKYVELGWRNLTECNHFEDDEIG
jgi:hypothetical protein